MMILKVEDVFKEIPGDPDNVLLIIPPEICEQLAWIEGTVLTITVEDGKLSIKKNEQ